MRACGKQSVFTGTGVGDVPKPVHLLMILSRCKASSKRYTYTSVASLSPVDTALQPEVTRGSCGTLKGRYRGTQPTTQIIHIIIIIDRLYIALFSALEQTHCAPVVCDSE